MDRPREAHCRPLGGPQMAPARTSVTTNSTVRHSRQKKARPQDFPSTPTAQFGSCSGKTDRHGAPRQRRGLRRRCGVEHISGRRPPANARGDAACLILAVKAVAEAHYSGAKHHSAAPRCTQREVFCASCRERKGSAYQGGMWMVGQDWSCVGKRDFIGGLRFLTFRCCHFRSAELHLESLSDSTCLPMLLRTSRKTLCQQSRAVPPSIGHQIRMGPLCFPLD